jgi:hypothetical protein
MKITQKDDRFCELYRLDMQAYPRGADWLHIGHNHCETQPITYLFHEYSLIQRFGTGGQTEGERERKQIQREGMRE